MFAHILIACTNVSCQTYPYPKPETLGSCGDTSNLKSFGQLHGLPAAIKLSWGPNSPSSNSYQLIWVQIYLHQTCFWMNVARRPPPPPHYHPGTCIFLFRICTKIAIRLEHVCSTTRWTMKVSLPSNSGGNATKCVPPQAEKLIA